MSTETTALNGSPKNGYHSIPMGEDISYDRVEIDNKIFALGCVTILASLSGLVGFGWSIGQNWDPQCVSHGVMSATGIGVVGTSLLLGYAIKQLRTINTKAYSIAQKLLRKQSEINERLTKEESDKIKEGSEKLEKQLKEERAAFNKEKASFEEAAKKQRDAMTDLQAAIKASQISSPASIASKRRESLGGINSPLTSPGGGSPVTVGNEQG